MRFSSAIDFGSDDIVRGVATNHCFLNINLSYYFQKNNYKDGSNIIRYFINIYNNLLRFFIVPFHEESSLLWLV